MVPRYSENGDRLKFEAIARFPEVAHATLATLFFDAGGLEVLGTQDYEEIKRVSKVIEGRFPRPDQPNEVIANFLARDHRRIRVGDTIVVNLPAPGQDVANGGEIKPGPAIR